MTSAADYPTLGFDPTPGELAEVAEARTALSQASTALQEISSVLHGADDGEWRGMAARKFRELLDEDLRPKVDRAGQAFSDAHRNVESWHGDLADFQRRARTLESNAADAQGRAEAARAQLDAIGPAPGPGTPPPQDRAERDRLEQEQQDRSRWQDRAGAAAGEVDGYRDQARTLNGEYESRGREVAELLQGAVEVAPGEPGWFDSVVDALGDFVGAIGDVLGEIGDVLVDVLEELAPVLDLIGDVLGVVSTVLGLLAFIPGLQFLAMPALVLGGIGLAATYLSKVGESGSFLEPLTDPEVLIGAVSLACGVGALKLGARLTSVARASGNTRMVPQLVGQAREVPYGFFHIARGTVTSMETAEFTTRTVALHNTWASFGAIGAGASGNVDTIQRIARGDFLQGDRDSVFAR